ncbi:type IV secretory system conjugative DNA transfer family protein [Amycolatopsis rifamycinica]|uniref:Type IV secretion system coupling protein TraD DNA-binding domain-containing protein n=1 Tax=Amycolatopsis rifamycinica TaxID=287986 RepID=A0A066UG06_9PSEU|nr:type IV secretory system conjugative DNA transfer family protein [Amycolatopsis rifamycinica]KDN23133.1 hypothetical protein DV20_05290 [Amycolatopsis rifamycinica]
MGPTILYTTSVLAALVPGALFVGRMHMKKNIQPHRSYVLTFPTDLSGDQLVTWLTSVTGTLRTGPGRLLGVPTIVFEVWADELGIRHRLKVPAGYAEYIVPQLRSLIPGITATPEGSKNGTPAAEATYDFTSALEIGQTNPLRGLQVNDSVALSASILTNLQGLKSGEKLLIQWVTSPALQERPPRGGHVQAGQSGLLAQVLSGSGEADKAELADRQARANQPSFLGVLRVAAKASTKKRADQLLFKVKASVASVRSPYNSFKKRLVTTKTVIGRIKEASAPFVFPAQLSANELSGLISWPLGSPHIAGLPQSRTRHLAPTGAVPKAGRVIARSNFPGAERLLALSPVESAQHLQVVGPTGSGKTALLSNLIAQDMAAGHGVLLIESKGDLFNTALQLVPEHRVQDVVLVDVADVDHPVGFNILQGSPYVVAADIQRLFDHLYPQDARGVRVRQGFYHLILTLMMSRNIAGATFADIAPLSVPRVDQVDFSDEIVRGVSHVEELATWWQEITNLPRAQRDLYFKPITDRIWQLTSRRSIRNIIGQSTSTINLRDVIAKKKILLVNLGRATEGKDTAGLLGSLILNSIWSAVQAGAADPRDPTMLYLDEFQDFLNLPISPADMFAQARSMGLAVTVAHQFLNQLSRELQEATQNNARSTVVFQTSADEARHFARQFGRSVTEDDFMHLRRFEVLMRLATAEGVSVPVTGVTMPPREPTGFGATAREESRQKYGRPVRDVERDIATRRGVKQEPKKKPKLGGKEWRN